jgi:hypothetical protein
VLSPPSCGIKYTEALETIITEYRISVDSQRHLDDIQRDQRLPIALTLKVFSEGAWPMQNQLELPIEHFPREMQDAQKCLDLYAAQHLSKKTLKLSGMESKVRWAYYFDEEVCPKFDSCYLDTNALQALLLFKIYRSRPHRTALLTLEQQLPKVSPKLIRECLAKMVRPPLFRPTPPTTCCCGPLRATTRSSASTGCCGRGRG